MRRGPAPGRHRHPVTYVTDPLRVFKLDFEENLKIVRLCEKYGKT